MESKRLLSMSLNKGDEYPLDIARQVLVDSTTLSQHVSNEMEQRHDAICCGYLIETVNNLRSVVGNLAASISELLGENDELEGEVKRLRKRICTLEFNEQTLIVGQIAFKVEKDILSYVMEGIAEPTIFSIYTIRDMEKGIEQEKRFEDAFNSDNERSTASKRWIHLKSVIGWKNKHYRDIRTLKSTRVDIAHPEINHEQFREAIEKVCCQDKHLQDVSYEFLKMLTEIPYPSEYILESIEHFPSLVR